MAKIFIDVGGYHGHSTMAALDPIFGFDRIFCFEPVPQCLEIIRHIHDKRIVLVQACLSKTNGEVTLFNPGTLAASVYADAPEFGGTAPPLTATAISAGDFYAAFLQPEDRVWMKLNCEGSECDIIESIIDSNQHPKIKNALIDYDALKIRSQKGRVSDVQARVIEAAIPHSFPQDVQYGMVTNYGGVRNWLIKSGACEAGFVRAFCSVFFNLRIMLLRPELSGYHKMRLLKALPFLAVFAKSRRRRLTS
jgi:FkbM family methyltransferase